MYCDCYTMIVALKFAVFLVYQLFAKQDIPGEED